MRKTKVSAYCRVSTNKKDQINSFENQKSFFEREINKNEKYELHAIYSDKGLSGTSLNKREQFTNMLYDAGLDFGEIGGKIVSYPSKREPKFNRILVSNSSRFARNVEVVSVLRDLRQKGVYVDFLDIDKTTENPDDEFIIIFFLNLDQQHSIDKSKKVRFGHLESANKGKIFTNKSIYGYDYIPETNSLNIIEEEASVVKKIFDLYASGVGIRRIAEVLDAEGIKTRKGLEFAKTTIRKILDNEKYCGILVRNKYDTGIVFNKKNSPKIKPKSEWIIHEGKVPAIVSKEIFEKCQKLLESKAGDQRGIHRGHSEFAGFIYCGKCGHTYTRNIDAGKIFYNCGLKKTRGTKVCDNVNVHLYHIEEVLEVLQKGMLQQAFFYDKHEKIGLLDHLERKLEERLDKDKASELETLYQERNVLKEQENVLIDLYLKGFDKTELDKRKEQINKSVEEVEQKIREASKDNDKIFEEIAEIRKQKELLTNLEIGSVYSREEIIGLLKSITITQKEENKKEPHLTLEFKVFDLINRLVDNYVDKSKSTETTLRYEYESEDQKLHLRSVSKTQHDIVT